MLPSTAAAYDHLLVALGSSQERFLDGLLRQAFRAQVGGILSDSHCETLHQVVQSRRTVFEARRRVRQDGRLKVAVPRPRDDNSHARAKRRVWGASGALPHHLRARFTPGENAVAAVIRAEVGKHGACTLPYGTIAKAAGLLSTTVVKRFVRRARSDRLIAVEERREPGCRNKPNVITIVSIDWLAWNDLGERGHDRASHTENPEKELSRKVAMGSGSGHAARLRRDKQAAREADTIGRAGRADYIPVGRLITGPM